MPTSLIKKYANELAPIVTFIINDIFDSGNYPVQLKEATLTPIIKTPSMDTESLGSYRPVSQNCFLSKIIDSELHTQMKTYLDENELESISQAGYKSNNSCETMILALYDKLYEDYDKDKI